MQKLIILLLSLSYVHSTPTRPEKRETLAEEPWNWNIKYPSDYEVTVEEIIPDDIQEKSARIEDIQPRFVGKLKKKLCKMGIGCNQGYTEIGHAIAPQDINYVQPLVIKPIGKPIPAVPAQKNIHGFPGLHATKGGFGGYSSPFPSGGSSYGSQFSHVHGPSGHSSGQQLMADFVFEPNGHGSKGSQYFNLGAPLKQEQFQNSFQSVYGPPAGPPHPSDILVTSDKIKNFPSTNFGVTHLSAETISSENYAPSTSRDDFTSRELPSQTGVNVIKHIHIHQHVHQVKEGSPSEYVSELINQYGSAPNRDNAFLPQDLGGKSSSKRQVSEQYLSQPPSFIKTRTRSCTCVPKFMCPSKELVLLMDDQNGSSSMQEPRNSIESKDIIIGKRLDDEIADTSELDEEIHKLQEKIKISRKRRFANIDTSQNWIPTKIPPVHPRHSSVSSDLRCSARDVCCELGQFGNKRPNTNKFQPDRLESRSHVQCGVSRKDSIIGRQKAQNLRKGETGFGEFPWQSAILKKDGEETVYICSGSLIDSSHVLTAAHCIDGYKASELVVRLGEWNVNADNEFYSYLELDVVGVAEHDDFYPGNLANDIAVIRLLYPVDFDKNPHIAPICLPSSIHQFEGERCWATGWGTNTFGQKGRYQTLLKKVDLPIVPSGQCESDLKKTRLGASYKLHPGMLCAGGEPLKDACKGDGGGPLSCQNENGEYVLTGIVSWGIGCGQPGVPGVYAKVQYYLNWIKRTVSS